MIADKRRRIRAYLCYPCAVLVALATGVAAADPPPILLRTAVAPDADIWVGQQVMLRVDVLGRDGWAQIRKVRDFDVTGAYVLRTQTQGVRLNESVEGQAYTGQRYEISLYPQRGGRITVSSALVDVEVKTWGAAARTTAQRMETPPVGFDVKVPPGAERIPGLISTKRLTVKQAWAPEPGDFKVGDAVKRTITLEAADASGMSFVPIEQDPIEGVSIYPEEPSVNDKTDRGALTGTRVETVTYVFERDGTVDLPSFVVQWWNLGSKKLIREELQGFTLDIAPNPALQVQAVEEAVTGEVSGSLRWLLPVVIGTVLAAAVWRYGKKLHVRLEAWRNALQCREAAYFGRFRDACRSGDPAATMRALMVWLDHTGLTGHVGSLERLVEGANDPELAEQIRVLESRLYGTRSEPSREAAWSGDHLYRRVASVRKDMRRAKRGTTRLQRGIPALNPALRMDRE